MSLVKLAPDSRTTGHLRGLCNATRTFYYEVTHLGHTQEDMGAEPDSFRAFLMRLRGCDGLNSSFKVAKGSLGSGTVGKVWCAREQR